jgi:hypothetical protein
MGPVAFAVAQNDYPGRDKEQGDAIYEGPYYAARYLEHRNVANYVAAARLAQGMPTSGFAIDLYQRALHLAPKWTEVSGLYLAWLIELGPPNGNTEHDEKLHNLSDERSWRREVGRLADQIISVAEGKVEKVRAVEGLVDKYYVIAYAARTLPNGWAYDVRVAAKRQGVFERTFLDYLNWMCRLGGQLAAAQGRLDEEYDAFSASLAWKNRLNIDDLYGKALGALRESDTETARKRLEEILERVESLRQESSTLGEVAEILIGCRAAQQSAILAESDEEKKQFEELAAGLYREASKAYRKATAE